MSPSTLIYYCEINSRMMELFEHQRLFTHSRGGNRWKLKDVIHFPIDSQIEPYANLWAGSNLPRRMGAFSYSHSLCDFRLSIGRYTSIGPSVTWLGDSHPVDWATTSPFAYEPKLTAGFDAYLTDFGASHRPHPFDQRDLTIEVGNDVWIGQNVLIHRGIRIGDGAVVGAGSNVTRSVPPYAIVAGNPARLIRYRFGEQIVERMLQAQWWQYGLDAVGNLDPRDPRKFLDDLGALDPTPLVLQAMTGQDILQAARAAPAD